MRPSQSVEHEQGGRGYVVLGVIMHFLSTPEESNSDVAVLKGNLLPGTVIPLHHHQDAEVLYILEGTIEIYKEPIGWAYASVGDTVTISSGVKHALRNTSLGPVTTLTITGDSLFGFFRELAKPLIAEFVPGPPSAEEMQHLFQSARKHHYWMGSPEENAAIGLLLR